MEDDRACEICGKKLKRYQARFCCHGCRGAWVKSETEKRRAPRSCKVCGAPVSHRPRTGSDTVVCSDECLRESRRLTGLKNVEAGKGPPRTVQTAEHREASRKRITGANAPWWKGGVYAVHSGRYMLAIPPADYPFPESIRSSGRILEHRMVMELHIGRRLERREVVHHVNGNSTDNRIENLRLYPSHKAHMREGHSAS